MLLPELLDRAGEADYRFCPDPECPVVYFTLGNEATFMTVDLRVRIGLKERVGPIPLCYCFGFTEADAREEVLATGTSSIPQRITGLIKQKLCECAARNPSGSCCLGEVSRCIKRLTVELSELSQPV
jgi:Zinc binding domain